MTISRRIRFVIFGVACATVAWVSLLPADDLPPTGMSDKLEHFIAYGVLALIGSWAYRARTGLALVLIAMGIVIEGLQWGMGMGRHADVLDALANSMGVILGMMAALALGALRRR